MGRDKTRFYFKHFSVAHTKSSLKVGVDGVLIGAWADCNGAGRVLDVGTGCGVIALMMAQRERGCRVIGIDIDGPSVEEATSNFLDSPMSCRVKAEKADFLTYNDGKFDLIVSNPPFFKSGVTDMNSARMAARHQASLPLSFLLTHSADLLNPGGKVALILPAEFEAETISKAREAGLFIRRICRVRGHADAPMKRTMLEFILPVNDTPLPENPVAAAEPQTLTLETSPGVPTEEYRELCKEFYLKF